MFTSLNILLFKNYFLETVEDEYEDNRKEIFQNLRMGEKANVDKVCGIFRRSQFDEDNGIWRLKGENGFYDHIPWEKDWKFCDGEEMKFYGQPLGPLGTGFALKPNYVTTVSHNIKDLDQLLLRIWQKH